MIADVPQEGQDSPTTLGATLADSHVSVVLASRFVENPTEEEEEDFA